MKSECFRKCVKNALKVRKILPCTLFKVPYHELLFLPKLFLLFFTSYHLKQSLAPQRAFLGRSMQVFHVWDLRVITDSDLRDQSGRTCFSHCLPAGRRPWGDEEKGGDISVIKLDCGVKSGSHTKSPKTQKSSGAYLSMSRWTVTNTAKHYTHIVILCCQNAEQCASDTSDTSSTVKALMKKGRSFPQENTLSLKKQQRPLKRTKSERKRRKHGWGEGYKLSGVRLGKVHPARDVDECASGFKLALQPPAVWIPRLR